MGTIQQFGPQYGSIVDSPHVLDGILAAGTLMLQGAPSLRTAGITTTRLKSGCRLDLDLLPALFLIGGNSQQLDAVLGGYVMREYQVFGVLLYAGNYLFRSGFDLTPNGGEIVRKAMLVNRIPGTSVSGSRVGPQVQFDASALEIGYEKSVCEIWYKTTEPRN